MTYTGNSKKCGRCGGSSELSEVQATGRQRRKAMAGLDRWRQRASTEKERVAKQEERARRAAEVRDLLACARELASKFRYGNRLVDKGGAA